MSIQENIERFKNELPDTVTLVAVSKTKPSSDIQQAYDAGQRIFGENRVQEMAAKFEELPKDIEWHMIGHCQRNKVKYMAPFVSLIHSVDSPRLFRQIEKEAKKADRTIDCLLQLHIADEESKYGFEEDSLFEFLRSDQFKNADHTRIRGLMGMATLTDDQDQIREEFKTLSKIYDLVKSSDYLRTQDKFDTLSMGMTGDYKIAIEEGANQVRIGSAIFGKRD